MVNGLMKKTIIAMGLGVSMAAVLPGCVSQGAHDNTMEANRSLQERNTLLARRLQEREATVQQQADQLSRNESTIAELQQALTGLRGQLTSAHGTIEEFGSRMNDIAFGPLDPETDRALAQLASKHPGLVAYDADRGMLRFKSDLTFGSGSDEVKPEAKTGLIELAGVLKTSAGSAYELLVVGHTDAQPISNPTTRKNHPTNVHLSAHRAIAVRSILRDSGVPASSMQVAGWGEHRPIVPNTSTGATPQNRRVEIYLTRGTAASPMSTTSVGEIDRAEPPTSDYETTK